MIIRRNFLATGAALGIVATMPRAYARGPLYLALASSRREEACFSGYARVAVPRERWQVEDEVAELRTPVDFPACIGGAEHIVGFGVFDSAVGGRLFIDGPLTPDMYIGYGITARIVSILIDGNDYRAGRMIENVPRLPFVP